MQLKRNRRLASVFAAGLSALAIARHIPAAPGTEDAIAFWVRCPTKEYHVLEPLNLQMVITNVRNTNISCFTEYRNGIGWVGYQISRDGKAFNYIRGLANHDPTGKRTVLKPHEEFRHEETLWFDRGNGPIFSEPGNYFLRVTYPYLGRHSEVIKIHVKPVENAVDVRWATLFQSPEFLAEAQVGGSFSTNMAQQLRNCAQEPSIYAPYAALLLGRRTTNLLEALLFLEKADTPSFPLRSQAIYEIGWLNWTYGNHQQAHEHFKRLVAQCPDSFAAWKAKRNGFLASKSLNPTNHAEPPEESFAGAIKRLETEGYDWKGFLRGFSPPAREYERKCLQIYGDYMSGPVPAEAYKKMGELLESYVRKNSEPLSQEELKRRLETYSTEEAERMARHLEDQKRRAKEEEAKLSGRAPRNYPK